MHAVTLNYFSRDGCTFKGCCWGISMIFCYNNVMCRISNLFIKLIVCLWCQIDFVNFSELHHSTRWSHSVSYVFICVIYFCRAQICTNEYFDSNYFFAKGHNFLCPLSSSKTRDDSNKSPHGVSLFAVSI